MTSKIKKEDSFKESFAELEKIVQEFETGEMDLDESLEKFEQGLALAAACKKRLSEIENRVSEIKKKFSAQLQDTPPQDGDATPF